LQNKREKTLSKKKCYTQNCGARNASRKIPAISYAISRSANHKVSSTFTQLLVCSSRRSRRLSNIKNRHQLDLPPVICIDWTTHHILIPSDKKRNAIPNCTCCPWFRCCYPTCKLLPATNMWPPTTMMQRSLRNSEGSSIMPQRGCRLTCMAHAP